MGECKKNIVKCFTLLALYESESPVLLKDLTCHIRSNQYLKCYITKPTMRNVLEGFVENGYADKRSWRYQITAAGFILLREAANNLPKKKVATAGVDALHRFIQDYDENLDNHDPSENNDNSDHVATLRKISRQLLEFSEKRLEEEGEIYPYDVLSAIKNRSFAGRFNVYVVKLDPKIRPRKRATNDGNLDLPCVYVGKTGFSPEERFQRHKDDIQAGRGCVRDYGLLLMPDLYDSYNPIDSSDRALEVEAALAEKLRRLGYTVYGGH